MHRRRRATSPTSAAGAATPRSTGRWRSCCATRARPHRLLAWEPWGGDERQFCSPGFDLPVGTLMRTPHGEFDGYHTSADGLDRIRPESLAEAVDECLALVDVLETNRRLHQPEPVRRAAARSPRPLPHGRRRGRDARRRARAALGAERQRRRARPCSTSPATPGCRTKPSAARRSGSSAPSCSRLADHGRARPGHRCERADRRPGPRPARGRAGRGRGTEPYAAPGRGPAPLGRLRPVRARGDDRGRRAGAAGRSHPPRRRGPRRPHARRRRADPAHEPDRHSGAARGGDPAGLPPDRAQRIAAGGTGRRRTRGRAAVAVRRLPGGGERLWAHVLPRSSTRRW